MAPPRRVAVIGAGWAGLAAAVHATRAGHAVTLFEMAPQAGGRARQVDVGGVALDNGQHILIGAYRDTLALMAQVGVRLDDALLRTPLRLSYPDGTGLHMPAGAPVPAFLHAVMGFRGWGWRDKAALLAAAASWRLRGFRCDAGWTVQALTAGLPRRVQADLIEPLCVAALNTAALHASAQVFLRVLQDALFAGPGSADLLLPRRRLSALLPDPALRWLIEHGATVRLSHRVSALARDAEAWRVDGERFDAVVLACTAVEAARLAAPHAPEWVARARSLRHEPIVTVYAHSAGTQLSAPMFALRDSPAAPAQFVFDLGALGGPAHTLAFVISGAAAWVARGVAAIESATLAQAESALGAKLTSPLTVRRTLTEKRATFLCTPGLMRPGVSVAPCLAAAGDYVDGPYPATLEGAVRSGFAAAQSVVGHAAAASTSGTELP